MLERELIACAKNGVPHVCLLDLGKLDSIAEMCLRVTYFEDIPDFVLSFLCVSKWFPVPHNFIICKPGDLVRVTHIVVNRVIILELKGHQLILQVFADKIGNKGFDHDLIGVVSYCHIFDLEL